MRLHDSVYLLLLCPALLFGQSDKEVTRKGRPDIPGTFAVEFGFNRMTRPPQDLKYGFWGSRTLNVYYYYDQRIGNTKFSVHPGIGLGMERFKLLSFNQTYSDTTIRIGGATLIRQPGGNTQLINSGRVLFNDTTRAASKSMFIMNYLDIPIEFRFTANTNDPAKSFKAAIGGRIGFLLNAHTKLNYKEDNETKKIKNRQGFNLNEIRYSAFARIGVGNAYLSFYYNFSDLFKEGRGPDATRTSTYTMTLTLAAF
ncbi:MAG: PorT family protein [Cyclobacteriaceae bacterium]|nr:PorT family protein [Cyclobacteriaceae bacterium]